MKEKFFNNSMTTIASRAVVYISMLTISVYVARVLGPSAKGSYAVMLQFLAISVMFMQFGIDNASIFYLGKGVDLKRMFPNLILITVVSSVIFLFTVFAIWNLLREVVFSGIVFIFIILTVLRIPFNSFIRFSNSAILGKNMIRLSNILMVSNVLLTLGAFLVFSIITKEGLKGVFTALLVGDILTSIAYFIVISRLFGVQFNVDYDLIKKLFKYGMKAYLAPLLLLIIFRLDFFILNYMKGTTNVGYYSVAISCVEILFFLPEAIGIVFFSKLCNISDQKIKDDNSASLLRSLIFLIGTLAVFMFLFFPSLLVFIFGVDYTPSVFPFRILLPGAFLMSLYYIFFSYFYAKSKPGLVTSVISLTMLFKIVLSVLLIPRCGIIGAAVSSSATYIFCAIIFIVLFMKHSGYSVSQVFVIRFSDIKYLFNKLKRA